MKSSSLFALPAALFFALPAQAELPPQYQRAAELKAVISHPDLVGRFPGMEMVQRVEYVRPNLYRVSTEACSLYAKIASKPLPHGMVGARQFDVVLGKTTCPKD